jgi:hypothetical protein
LWQINQNVNPKTCMLKIITTQQMNWTKTSITFFMKLFHQKMCLMNLQGIWCSCNEMQNFTTKCEQQTYKILNNISFIGGFYTNFAMEMFLRTLLKLEKFSPLFSWTLPFFTRLKLAMPLQGSLPVYIL